ncbi:hypothetical protein SZN_18241 [Streptomyces zinciresistens K42]|uniref:Uncharacterized protein n=1 Tax=Streptomyces zinciresistens K42 TaxID=700597 RepID=G2GDS0_9ACTN|nr:hypothetical protein SZN_18241 [Streptomyces zinciresistens K42]
MVLVRNIRYLLAAGLTLDDVRVLLLCLDGEMAAARPQTPSAYRSAGLISRTGFLFG